MKTLNPEWEPFRISFYDLCKADPKATLLLECYDYNKYMANVLIGSAEVRISNLLESFGPFSVALKSPSATHSGTFYFECIPYAASTRLTAALPAAK